MRTIKTWLATIAVLLFSVFASAYDFKDYRDGKDIYFNIIDEVNMTAEVTYGSNLYVGSVVIPSTVSVWVSDAEEGYILKTYNVIGIGVKTFQESKDLYSVTIPNSIVYIGENAFSGCDNLDEVHISDLSAWCNIDFTGVSNPLYAPGRPFLVLNGEKVFDLVIPDDVKEIKKLAFHGCSSLQTLSISNSVTTIGKEAFEYSAILHKINIVPQMLVVTHDEEMLSSSNNTIRISKVNGISNIETDETFFFEINSGVIKGERNDILVLIQ